MEKRIKRIIAILFFLLLMFQKNSYAIKNNDINFQSITVDNGLSQSLAEEIYQDSYGYIWIATNDGLNRYNGNDFKVYKNIKNNPNSLSSNAITGFIEDDNKNLWISTASGLNKMNLITGDVRRYLVSEQDKRYSNSFVDEVFKDSKDRIWACTINGLNLYDSEKDCFNKVASDFLEDKWIQGIDEDEEGNLWIATRDGLYRYNPDTDLMKVFHKNDDDYNAISDNNIFSVQCINNKVYIGTKIGGLNIIDLNDYSIKVYTNDSNNPNSLPSNYIRKILKSDNGVIWIGTDQGLVAFDENDETFYTYKHKLDKFSICDNNICDLYQDKSGVIWVATFNGISKFADNNYFKVYRNEPLDNNSLSNNSVCGIYEDNEGLIWVGTFNSGINIIDKNNNKVTRIYNDSNGKKLLSSNSIKAIAGIENEIWIATDNGLNKYDKISGQFTVYKTSEDTNSLINNEVRALFIDKSGVIWIGTRGGVCSFDRKDTFRRYDGIFEKNNIFEKVVNSIYEDVDGRMWFGLGNDGGLVRFDRDTEKIKTYLSSGNDDNSLSFNTVRAITEDGKGNLWVGTQDGLNKFNKETENFQVYRDNDGLSNNFIYGALVDENDNIWVSTNYGISMYDQKADKFVRYYESDGIASNESNGYSYYKNKNGVIYFGGVNGVTEIEPSAINLKVITSNIIIESIEVNNSEEVKVKKNIVLDYNSRNMCVKFFMPEYKNRGEVQYAYKLEGYDKEWILLKNDNYAIYTNIPPGKYKMSVSGRNYNGIWTEITEINVKVKNSSFKTPFAYFIYISVIMIIVLIVYNQVRILDSLVVQRTNELKNKLEENKNLYSKLIQAEKYKNNYFINLSHELRTPLNVILSVAQLILSLNKSGKKISTEKIDGYMNSLKSNSNRLLNMINNIIDTSKIESDTYIIHKENINIVSLVEDTALSMVNLAEVKGIELILDPEVEEIFIRCDKLDIERCIINLLGNAIKFTNKDGSIIVTISEVDCYARISVKDTGIGISPEYQNSIFDRFGQVYSEVSEEFGGNGLGLTLTKNLITLHGGEISVISKLGKGSEFIILLPLNNEM